jgi:hypothetical protein
MCSLTRLHFKFDLRTRYSYYEVASYFVCQMTYSRETVLAHNISGLENVSLDPDFLRA